MQTTFSVALIRGNGMNAWEGRLWNDLPEHFKVTGFCANKNLFPMDELTFSIKQLPTTTDSSWGNKLSMLGGVFQKMSGLEKKLNGFAIAHTVEIYNYYTYQAVQAKKSNKELKVVTTVWDNSFARLEYGWSPFPTPGWWQNKMKKLIAANAAGVDRFLAVSSSSAKLLRTYDVPEEKISIVVPGLAETPEATTGVLQSFGLAGKKFFLMVNRLRKEKGVYECLEAWKIFLQQNSAKQPLLVIVGDGPERESMLSLIKKWGIQESILYIQSLPNNELRQLYLHAVALILASKPTPLWEEQFGYVLVEAMTAGCPVVSTTSGAIPEVVGTGGILVPPGDVLTLSEALSTMQQPAMREKYVVEARQAKTRFSAKRFQKEIIKIYSELV